MTIHQDSALKRATLLFGLTLLMLLAATPALAQSDPAAERETDPLVLAKLEWFQDLKFGLLMHWGTYSQWQIVESWSLCPEDENWCERRGDHAKDYFAYKQAYENLKTTFNPVQFDPAAWAAAAKERRHALRRLHDQAPRRLLHVRHAGDRLQGHRPGLPLQHESAERTSPERSSMPSARRASASAPTSRSPTGTAPTTGGPTSRRSTAT